MLNQDEELYLRQQALMNALEFTTADLAVNQSGVLTDAQRARLYELSCRFRRDAFAYGFATVTAIVVCLMLARPRTILGSQVAIYLYGGIFILLSYRAYTAFWNWRGYTKAMRSPLQTVRGRFRKVVDDVGGKPYFAIFPLYIRDKRFLAASPLDDIYSVYYEPKTQEILSAEWHGQANDV